jgi:uncharacterized protein (TIGR03382 family)
VRLVGLAALATIGAVLGAAPRPSHACSCTADPEVVPGDGATDVPTNVVFVVRNGPTRDYPGAYTLAGPDGAIPVAVDTILVQASHSVEIVEPLVPLAPDTDYTLRSPPDDLVSAAPLDVTIHTGLDADRTTPGLVELGELLLARAGAVQSFSCGAEYTFVSLRIAAPPEAVAVDIFVTTGSSRTHFIVPPFIPAQFLSSWDGGCSLQIPLVVGELACFEVRARDAAGNQSPPTERCGFVAECDEIAEPEFFDGDLTDCVNPYDFDLSEPDQDPVGCRATRGAPPLLPVAALALLYAVRRRERPYAVRRRERPYAVRRRERPYAVRRRER